MEESIKKIMHSKTLLAVILIIITFILYTNVFIDPKENNTNKGIGIKR